jgi:hypothetical protein
MGDIRYQRGRRRRKKKENCAFTFGWGNNVEIKKPKIREE